MLNVLIVSDTHTMRSILRSYLNHFGAIHIHEADHGEQALKIVYKHRSNPIDLVICDMHMKGMDGLEFCQQLRIHDHSDHPDIPVIMLSGDHDEMLCEVAQQLGVAKLVFIPVSGTDFDHHVSEVIGYDLNDEVAAATL